MLGFGTASGGMPSYHIITSAISGSKVAVSSSLSNVGGSSSTSNALDKAHVALMAIVWVLLTSVGIMLAHILRKTSRGKQLLDSHLWLVLHRLFFVLAVVCTAVGFIVVLVGTNGISAFMLSDPVTYQYQLQGTLVVVGLILALVNPIVILAQPKPGNSSPQTLTSTQKFIGFVLYPITGITMLLGVAALYQPNNVKDYALFWLLIVAIVVHLTAHVLLVHDKRCSRSKAVSANGDLEMTDSSKEAEVTGVNNTASVDKSDRQTQTITLRLAIFIIYAVTMAGLTVAMVVLIGQS